MSALRLTARTLTSKALTSKTFPPKTLHPQTFTRAFSSTPQPQLARITLIGRLGAAPEAHTTRSGAEIIKYAVAVNRGNNEENRQTAWWKVSSFTNSGSKLGELLLGLAKGTQVYVEGDVWNSSFEGQDGKLINGVNIVQTKIEILKKPLSAEDGEGASAGAEAEAEAMR